MDGIQANSLPLRRANNNERFVAFAFAGAEMLAETDVDGRIIFAAGAFRSTFGQVAEAFVGRSLRDLVAPGDHEAVEQALVLLASRGRLLPLIIRMANAGRTCLALAGMALQDEGRPLRLCLSFAKPPAPATTALRIGSVQGLARRTEARLRSGEACSLELLDVVCPNGAAPPGASIEQAFGSVTDGIAGEIVPGRYGVLGQGGGADLASVAALLEKTLQSQGIEVLVSSQHLPLSTDGLTPTQAARALRQALNVFARDGANGLVKAGFVGGLAGYVSRAGASAGRLRWAIREGRFAMAFQPIVALDGRAIHHYEALIRPEPIEGCAFVGTQEFVVLVESLELADELDLAVARAACDAACRARVSVAFNLSGQSVQSPAFRERLLALLSASPARKSGLIMVEMTETAEIDDVDEAARTAVALRALNVPFCLDDFGAGAADIRLLRALAADIVKLDGSYVAGVAQSGRERAFIAGMIEVARAGGAAIVAERVETEAEAGALQDLGVQYGQGWLFGRPGPLPVRDAGRCV